MSDKKSTTGKQEKVLEQDKYIGNKTPITGTKKLPEDMTVEEKIVFPSTRFKKAFEFSNDERIGNTVPLEDNNKQAAGIGILGMDNTVPSAMLEKPLEEFSFTNQPTYEGSVIETRPIQVKSKSKLLKGRAAKAIAYTFIGVGGVIQIPLWHSGFRITLGTITSADRIALSLKISEAFRDIGANTAGLVFSNDMVMLVKILMEFIEDNILDTTLELEDGESVREYISALDINPLVLGLIQALAPKGFEVTLTCHNSLEINEEESEIKCNHSITGNVNPKYLLYVMEEALNPTSKLIISKTKPGSVSKADVKEYKDLIERLGEKVVEYKLADGEKKIRVTFKVPSIDTYISFGQLWLDEITYNLDELLASDDDADKNAKLVRISKATILNIYSHFVSEIQLDEDIISGDEEISGTLSALTLEPALMKDILAGMKEFVDESVISIVGTPAYTCPKCRKDVDDVDAIPPFSELIPLNVIQTFFDLSNLNIISLDNALSTEF